MSADVKGSVPPQGQPTGAAVYLESSYVLSWLFGEQSASRYMNLVDSASVVATSVLTRMEVERALRRAEAQKHIKSSERLKLLGMFAAAASSWVTFEISKSIREHVGQSFPIEPIRTLDAIHLATATMIISAYPDLVILSLDTRIRENATALGFEDVP